MREKNFLKSSIIAHRGVHHTYLENTIPSFKEAIKNHYIIELDVRLTKDKKVVVFHDSNLKRIFDIYREINDLTLKEIKKYRYIPTLEEVLKVVNGKVPIIIELKPDNRLGTIEKQVSKLLDNYKGKFAIQSFNPLSLWWFRLNRNNYIRGYLVHTILPGNFLLRFILNQNLLKKILKPDYIGINLLGLNQPCIKKIKDKYLLIGYTIETKKEYLKYKDKADNFICNIKKTRDCSPEDSLPKRIKRVG